MTGQDISTTLSDLERKLQDLERDLATAGTDPDAWSPAAPAPASAPSPVASTTTPAPPLGSAPASVSVPPSSGPVVPVSEIAELERFRERIEESARRLVEDYADLLARTAATATTPVSAWSPTPSPPLPAFGAPPAPTTSSAGSDGVDVLAPTVVPPGVEHAPPVPVPAPPSADPVVEGSVSIDAGPFADIATLSQFEQALARLPGAQDVYVKGFEGDRAQIDLEVTGPVALASALADVSPVPVTVHAPPPGGTVRLDIAGGHAHGA